MKHTRALMTAGVALATAWSAPALAADPIKLTVGGYGATIVGFASQDDGFLDATNGEVNAVDVKGDSEIHFSGLTTLDNGLTVAVHYEFEAGGRDVAEDTPDIWNISLSGEFGTLLAGADGTVLAAFATGAPRVGGRLFDGGLAEGDLIAGNYVINPGSEAPDAAFINSTGDAEAVSYVSPSLSGFTFGATYVPDTTAEDDPSMPGNGGAEAYGVAAQWVGEFGPVGLHVQTGWQTTDLSAIGEDLDEYQAGATLTYQGFSVGGAYKWGEHDVLNGEADDRAWEIGVAYESGPYGVSLGYIQTTLENGGTTGDDENRVIELAGLYNLGPGVDLVGGIGYVEFEDGVADGATQQQRDASENDGWVVATGLSLAF